MTIKYKEINDKVLEARLAAIKISRVIFNISVLALNSWQVSEYPEDSLFACLSQYQFPYYFSLFCRAKLYIAIRLKLLEVQYFQIWFKKGRIRTFPWAKTANQFCHNHLIFLYQTIICRCHEYDTFDLQARKLSVLLQYAKHVVDTIYRIVHIGTI